MTTAMITQPTVSTPVTVDLDTRLAIALAGMGAILGYRHRDTLDAAHDAANEAALWSTPEGPATFTSNRILAAAGNLIQLRGWHKGSWESVDGAVCALRAVKLAAGSDWQAERDTVLELLNRIAYDTGECYSIPGWNDSRTGPGEVLRLMY